MTGQLNDDQTYTLQLSHEEMVEMEKAITTRCDYWHNTYNRRVKKIDDGLAEDDEILGFYEERANTTKALHDTLYKIRRQK